MWVFVPIGRRSKAATWPWLSRTYGKVISINRLAPDRRVQPRKNRNQRGNGIVMLSTAVRRFGFSAGSTEGGCLYRCVTGLAARAQRRRTSAHLVANPLGRSAVAIASCSQWSANEMCRARCSTFVAVSARLR